MSGFTDFLWTEGQYLCDFAKRCPLSFRLNTGIVQASVAGKKPGGLPSCYVSAESPGPDLTVGEWLTCFVSKLGGREGRFCHFD